MGPGHGDYDVWGVNDHTVVCVVVTPFLMESRRYSMRRTVVINALFSCYGATLLFMGVASRECSCGVVLVLEVLNNIWLATNAFRLCCTTEQGCRYMVAPMDTVLKTNIMNNSNSSYMVFDLSGGDDVYGVRCSPGGKSQLVTSVA